MLIVLEMANISRLFCLEQVGSQPKLEARTSPSEVCGTAWWLNTQGVLLDMLWNLCSKFPLIIQTKVADLD